MKQLLVGASALIMVAGGCGETDSPERAVLDATPQPSTMNIVPPEVTETEDTLSISYPCPWVLHTYRNGHPLDQELAIRHLQSELDALVPARFMLPPSGFSAHSREWVIEKVMSYEWEELKEKELQAVYEERQRRNEERALEFRQKVREWQLRNSQP